MKKPRKNLCFVLVRLFFPKFSQISRTSWISRPCELECRPCSGKGPGSFQRIFIGDFSQREESSPRSKVEVAGATGAKSEDYKQFLQVPIGSNVITFVSHNARYSLHASLQHGRIASSNLMLLFHLQGFHITEPVKCVWEALLDSVISLLQAFALFAADPSKARLKVQDVSQRLICLM